MTRFVCVGLCVCLPLFAGAQRVRSTNWERGTVEKGEKIGEWEYFSYSVKGERVVTQRYDHTSHRLVYSRPDDKLYEVETAGGRRDHVALTQSPWFIGGHEALAAYTSKLNYPAAAQARNVEGRVVVSFLIDTLGRASGHRVVQSVGSGCDEEALRVSRTVPNQWLPGRVGSRAVPIFYELPFTFRLR